MSAEKSVETLSSSTDLVDNNFVSSDVNNCVNNIRGYEKRMPKKHRNNRRYYYKKFINCRKNIEPYKMKKSTKYVTTVKLIPGATIEGMIHHVKSCRVDFAPDIAPLHCGTNNLKKDFTPQKITQNILKLAEEVSEGGKRDVLVS